MARAGILYSDVVRAASLLIEAGKSVTVDNVREAMGGTGSKSTIAPMLKRWKLEHQEQVEASAAGLPVTLVQAVKAVYDHLQAEAGQQVELAQQRHQDELQATHKQEQLLLDEKVALARRSEVLATELKGAQQTIAKLQSEKQAMSVSLAALESDRSGLQLRLSDRSAEVAALNQQLTLARAQFDHYQEATAGQRAEEKQTYEQRIARLEHDLTGAQQRLLVQQSTIAHQETQIAYLNTDNTRLQEDSHAMLDDLSRARAERDQLSYQKKELVSSNQAFVAKLDASQQALSASQMAQAVQQSQNLQLTELLNQADAKLVKLEQERLTLIQERAELQAQAGSRQKTARDSGK